MYTLALAILIGFVAAIAVNILTDLVPAVNKLPILNRNDNLYILVTILIVWLTDTSVLGTYGIGNGAQWVDVVGSGLAIVGASAVVESVASYFRK